MKSEDEEQDELRRKITELFILCDSEKKGYIKVQDLQERMISDDQIDEKTIEDIFSVLDKKGNGYISLDDFFRCYKQFISEPRLNEDELTSLSPIDDNEECDKMSVGSFDAFVEESGLKGYIKSQDKSLRDSWNVLKQNQETLSSFELVLRKIAAEIKSQTNEKQTLGVCLGPRRENENISNEDNNQIRQELLSKETQLQLIVATMDKLKNELLDVQSASPNSLSDEERLQKEEAQILDRLENNRWKLEELEFIIKGLREQSKMHFTKTENFGKNLFETKSKYSKSPIKNSDLIHLNGSKSSCDVTNFNSPDFPSKTFGNFSFSSTLNIFTKEPPKSLNDIDGFEEVDIRRKSQDQEQSMKEYIISKKVFKVVFVGDSTVGKTSLINRFCTGCYFPNTISTIGVDYRTRNVLVDNKDNVCIQFWDTAGQERYRSITRQYFRKTDAVVIVYDISDEKSFMDIRSWLHDAREGAGKESVIVLLGNKVDLEGTFRKVPMLDGLKLSHQFDTVFQEVSALNGRNVECTLTQMVKLLLQKEDHETQKVLKLGLKNSLRRENCCRQ